MRSSGRRFHRVTVTRSSGVIGLVTACSTAFYMFRLLYLTFHGTERMDEQTKHHLHESPKMMTVPLMVLAVLSVIGGYVGMPHVLGATNYFEHWLAPVMASETGHGGEAATEVHMSGAGNTALELDSDVPDGSAGRSARSSAPDTCT